MPRIFITLCYPYRPQNKYCGGGQERRRFLWESKTLLVRHLSAIYSFSRLAPSHFIYARTLTEKNKAICTNMKIGEFWHNPKGLLRQYKVSMWCPESLTCLLGHDLEKQLVFSSQCAIFFKLKVYGKDKVQLFGENPHVRSWVSMTSHTVSPGVIFGQENCAREDWHPSNSCAADVVWFEYHTQKLRGTCMLGRGIGVQPVSSINHVNYAIQWDIGIQVNIF